MKGLSKNNVFLRRAAGLFNRCLWLYAVLAVILSLLIDRSQAYLNRMNVLKDVEYQLEDFLRNDVPLDRDTLRWAMRYYRELQRYAPDNSLYYANLGFCSFYLGEYDQAIRFYERAVALEPKLYFYHYDLGMIYFLLGRYDQAINPFLQCLNLVNDSVQYFVKSAEALEALTGQDLNFVALALIKRAGEDEETAVLLLTDIYSHLKDYRMVAVMADTGLQSHAVSWRLNYKAGWAAYMLGNFVRARTCFDQVIHAEPQARQAYYYRGLSFRRTGQVAAAERDFQTVRHLQDQGVPDPLEIRQDLKLHLNIELRILRQHYRKP